MFKKTIIAAAVLATLAVPALASGDGDSHHRTSHGAEYRENARGKHHEYRGRRHEEHNGRHDASRDHDHDYKHHDRRDDDHRHRGQPS